MLLLRLRLLLLRLHGCSRRRGCRDGGEGARDMGIDYYGAGIAGM